MTLKAYLLAVRFEKNSAPGDGKDNEFHLEIGAAPQWKCPHAVVEVTTGPPSCAARKSAWRLATADFAAGEGRPQTIVGEVAKIAKVDRKTARQAVKVIREAPEKAAAIKRGPGFCEHSSAV